MSEKIQLQFENTGIISSYQRMTYEYAHALAEFIDNSTHASRVRIDDLKKINPNYKLTVNIIYEPKEGLNNRGFIEIQDNACGMTKSVLQDALVIGKKPKIVGRSRYGMGMKTAAMWMGELITIRTKALGELKEYEVTLDISKIEKGDFDLPLREIDKADPNLSYTFVKVELLKQIPKGKALGTIKKQLSSIYRSDTRDKSIEMFWNSEEISWDDSQWMFLESEDGSGEYKKDFNFEITRSDGVTKKAYGWVGLLKSGGRTKAGFATLCNDRVIHGYPHSWRPESVFGDNSNDLTNQRLIGEIHFDDFEVSPTKDSFKWQLDEYYLIDEEMDKVCKDYSHKAQEYRRREGNNSSRATDQEKQEAKEDVKKEAESTVIIDEITTKAGLIDSELLVKATNAAVKKISDSKAPVFSIKFAENFTAELYTHEGQLVESYLQITTNTSGVVKIVVNESHPGFPGSGSIEALKAWYRMCLFDGIAEYKCQLMVGEIKPHTVREIKNLLYKSYPHAN
jgi:Histidine kinase-, DNA gyrase B-, and HSP90-like ATPase